MPPSAAFLSLALPMRCGPLSFRSTLKWMPCEMTSAMGVCAAVFSILQLHNPQNFNARNWNSAEEQCALPVDESFCGRQHRNMFHRRCPSIFGEGQDEFLACDMV